MDGVDPLLFLLMRCHFLRPNNARELLDLADLLRFLVIKMLVESSYCVLQVMGFCASSCDLSLTRDATVAEACSAHGLAETGH